MSHLWSIFFQYRTQLSSVEKAAKTSSKIPLYEPMSLYAMQIIFERDPNFLLVKEHGKVKSSFGYLA